MPYQDQSDQTSKRVCLGKIAGPHGVKGLVKLVCYGDDPQLLEDLSPLYIAEDRDNQIKIKLKNPIGRFYIAEIDGVINRNQAEEFSGFQLFVDRENLPDLDEEEDGYYIEDLKGRDVLDDNGTKIGIVKAIDNFGASDLLEVKPLKGHPFYIPFTDEFVPEVGETITIRGYEDFVG